MSSNRARDGLIFTHAPQHIFVLHDQMALIVFCAELVHAECLIWRRRPVSCTILVHAYTPSISIREYPSKALYINQ